MTRNFKDGSESTNKNNTQREEKKMSELLSKTEIQNKLQSLEPLDLYLFRGLVKCCLDQKSDTCRIPEFKILEILDEFNQYITMEFDLTNLDSGGFITSNCVEKKLGIFHSEFYWIISIENIEKYIEVLAQLDETIEQSGSGSIPKNSQEEFNNQIPHLISNNGQEVFEEISVNYWEVWEPRFEAMKEEVMDLVRDDAGLTMGGMTPYDFIDEEVSEEEIEDYMNENYEEIKEKLIDYVKENQW